MTEPTNGRTSIRLGELEINLPGVSDPSCSIVHDLAGLLGLEFNHHAEEQLKRAWVRGAQSGVLDLDHEADSVSIHAGRDAIVRVAVLIHELADPPLVLDPAEVERVRKLVRRHRRPKPYAWRVGELFQVPLADGRYCFGQVLWEQDFAAGSKLRAPTCTLLEHVTAHAAGPDALPSDTLEEILTARTVAILHVGSDHLDSQRWKVVGWHEPMDDPFSGPCGTPGKAGCVSWDGLETLANAYWGLQAWNPFYRDDYLDRFLLAGVERPEAAVMLDATQLAARGVTR